MMSDEIHWFDKEDFPDEIEPDEVLLELLREWDRSIGTIKSMASIIELEGLLDKTATHIRSKKAILGTIANVEKYNNRSIRYLNRRHKNKIG